MLNRRFYVANIKCKPGDWKKPIVFAEDDIFCMKILKRDLWPLIGHVYL